MRMLGCCMQISGAAMANCPQNCFETRGLGSSLSSVPFFQCNMQVPAIAGDASG